MIVYNPRIYSQNINHMAGLSPLITILTLLSIGSSFILSTHQGFKKCFSADVSPDKVLMIIEIDSGGEVWVSEKREAELSN